MAYRPLSQGKPAPPVGLYQSTVFFVIIDLVDILPNYARSATGPFYLTIFGPFYLTLFGPFHPTLERPFSPDPNNSDRCQHEERNKRKQEKVIIYSYISGV